MSACAPLNAIVDVAENINFGAGISRGLFAGGVSDR
jgi:hypothetical protein